MYPPCCPYFGRCLLALCVAAAGGTGAWLLLPNATPPALAQDAAPSFLEKDWPMFGGTPARNMANPVARNAPTEWEVEGGLKNVKWTADLGSVTYGNPVVANGRVYLGTDNAQPRDPTVKGNKGVLLCFQASDGKFLWQRAHDMPPIEVAYAGADKSGLISTPTVEGDRLYYMAPAAKLICAKADTGESVWELDLMEKYKVFPTYQALCGPLVVGDTLFAVTGNGVDEEGQVPAPEAPSFIAVEKQTGKVKWTSNLPGKNLLEGQFGNPAYAVVEGKPQVIFPGGDAWVYALEPGTGDLIWKFRCNPAKEEAAARESGIPPYPMATPVVYGNHAYVGVGVAPETGTTPRWGHFWAIDLLKANHFAAGNKDRDVSFRDDNLDPAAPVNKSSALAWHYGGELIPRPKFGRRAVFGVTLSTAAVHDGLVYITEENGYLHCLEARTGKKVWEHDFKSGIWGSPFYADGKVYVGTDEGEVIILKAGKEKEELNTIYMEDNIYTTPVLAEGLLFVATKSKLFAAGGN